MHGNGFQVVVIGGALFHRLFKSEAVVRLVSEIEVRLIVLRGVDDNDALFGERNIDVKYTNCKTNNECRP